MKPPVSVADKELTGSLSRLDSALTKNRGVGGVMVNQIRPAFNVQTCDDSQISAKEVPRGTVS